MEKVRLITYLPLSIHLSGWFACMLWDMVAVPFGWAQWQNMHLDLSIVPNRVSSQTISHTEMASLFIHAKKKHIHFEIDYFWAVFSIHIYENVPFVNHK